MTGATVPSIKMVVRASALALLALVAAATADPGYRIADFSKQAAELTRRNEELEGRVAQLKDELLAQV